jgi:hypothetical protein
MIKKAFKDYKSDVKIDKNTSTKFYKSIKVNRNA